MSNQDKLWEEQMKLEMEKSNLTQSQIEEIQEKVKNAKENLNGIKEISETAEITEVKKEIGKTVKLEKMEEKSEEFKTKGEGDQKLQNTQELSKILEKSGLDNELISSSVDSKKDSKESFQIQTQEIAKNNQISQFYTYFLIFLAQVFLNYYLYLLIFELINFVFLFISPANYSPRAGFSNSFLYSSFLQLAVLILLVLTNYKIMKSQRFQKAILNLRLK